MPFCLPTQVQAKLPVSRFKDINSAELDSTDFKLQKRKKTFRTAGKALYRIVTSHRNAGSRYLVARDDNIESLYRNEWHYIAHELPALVPPGLDYKDRTLWLIAHFTKLALEQKALSVRSQRTGSIGNENDMNMYGNDNSPPDSPHTTDNGNTVFTRTMSLGERNLSTGSTHSNGDNNGNTQKFSNTQIFNDDNVSFASPVLLPSVPIIPPLQHADCNICTHNYNLRLSLLHLPNTDNDDYHASSNNTNRAVQLSPTPISDYKQRTPSHPQSSPMNNTLNKQTSATKQQFRYKSIAEESKSDFTLKYMPYILIVVLNCAMLATMIDTRAFVALLILLNATALYAVKLYKPELLQLQQKHTAIPSLPVYTPPTESTVPIHNRSNSVAVPPVQRTKVPSSVPVTNRQLSHNRSQTSVISPTGKRFEVPQSPMSPLTPFTCQPTPRQFTNKLQVPHNRSQSDMDDVNYSAMAHSLNQPSPAVRRECSTGSQQYTNNNYNHKLSRTEETDEEDDQPAIIRHSQPPDASDIDDNHKNESDNDADHEISQSGQKHRQRSDESDTNTTPKHHTNDKHNNSDNADKLVPGKSLHKIKDGNDVDHATNAWTTIDATTFNVRKGPDYAHNKQKAKSKPSLFDLQSVDFYATNHKVHNIAQYVQLPGQQDFASKHKCEKQDCTDRPYLPATFIVHWLIPGYAVENPVWGKKCEDGVGHSLVLYYTLSDESKQMIYNACTHHDHSDKEAKTECFCQPDESKLSPALRLLHRYISVDDTDDLRKRFKAICRLCNVDDVGLGGMAAKLVHQYNGTPFLIRTTSTFYTGRKNQYFEIDVDTHRFSYPARLGLSGIREHIKQVISDFAFLIEGQQDDELPEQILSAVRLIRLDFEQAVKLPEKYAQE